MELLEESSHLSFVYEDNECSLVVLGAAEPDSGVYTCTARNLAGEVSCKAELVVRAGTASQVPLALHCGPPPGPLLNPDSTSPSSSPACSRCHHGGRCTAQGTTPD